MSVANAASGLSAANEVAVMVAAVAVVGAVNAPKAALSALANAALSEVKAVPSHVASATLKAVPRVVLNALQAKAVVTVAAKVVAVQNAPAKLAQTCAQRAKLAAKLNPAAKAVGTAIAVIVQNARTVVNVGLNAPAHPVMRRKRNWH